MDNTFFHKEYDLFNLSIVLVNDIFPDMFVGTYKVSLGISVKDGIGTIQLCNYRNINMHQVITEIYDYLIDLGLTKGTTKYANMVKTDASNIYNLVTLYRMKGMIQ